MLSHTIESVIGKLLGLLLDVLEQFSQSVVLHIVFPNPHLIPARDALRFDDLSEQPAHGVLLRNLNQFHLQVFGVDLFVVNTMDVLVVQLHVLDQVEVDGHPLLLAHEHCRSP